MEMELDHDSGAMPGHILAASLDELDGATRLGLLAEIDTDSGIYSRRILTASNAAGVNSRPATRQQGTAPGRAPRVKK
jgi:hypothetical protein